MRDDFGPSPSPDGKRLAFSTARWDTLSRYDIALLSLTDTVPHRLTSGPASDGGVVWSSDGGRLAFGRSNWGTKPNEVCVVALGDGALECHETKDEQGIYPAGWLHDDRIVVMEGPSDYRSVSVLQWSTKQSVRVFAGTLGNYSLSQDARWLYCTCATSANGEPVPTVLPLAASNLLLASSLDARKETGRQVTGGTRPE